MAHEPPALTPIEAKTVDDHVVIPVGMTPVLMHSTSGRSWILAILSFQAGSSDMFTTASFENGIVV